MKALVLAEKPSVARDIARVLKCNKKLEGAIEGEAYVVTWALGHLVTLADPEKYDKKYKEWNLEYLPMLPERFELEIIKQSGKQYNAVKKQLYRKDVGQIIIATDAGREGELVARLILEKANCHKPIKRLWISSVTDKAIRDGFAHLRNGKEYDSLYAAAQARAEADWIVGMNATRALTCKYNAQLSCGRVQTPTLAMIAKREEEIRNFKPKAYYGLEIRASFGQGQEKKMVSFLWRDKKSKGFHSFEQERIQAIERKCTNQKGKITEIIKTPKKSFSPGLYDLTELQRDANRRFGFSAKETLNIMQRLYENHKVLTYPRTDSRYITSDIVDTLKERLKACAVGPYRRLAGRLAMQPIKANASFVNNERVSDHHAIIPTEQLVLLQHMTSEERKIYDLVIKRFLAVLSPAFEYEQTTVVVELEEEEFVAKGKVVQKQGWKEVYEDQPEEEEEGDLRGQQLPSMRQGDLVEYSSIQCSTGKTKPPAPFNEATLLSAMENPTQYMESKDRSAIKVLGETGGLGTVATRADIIDKLFRSFLMEKRGKDIFITSKGKQLLMLVPSDLKKPELTAEIEIQLSAIAKGAMKKEGFMEKMEAYTKELVSEIKKGEGKFQHDNLTNAKCPVCGKRMLVVNGKNSKLLVCQDRVCGHRETISRTSNARCPVCHKKMELCGTGEKQVFICVCGHKEKLSVFQERRKKEGAGVSKKDVANYMRQQQKQEKESFSNPFAEALAKLK